MKNIIIIALVGLLGFVNGFLLFQEQSSVGAVAQVNTAYTNIPLPINFNDVITRITATTSTLGAISALSSSTGNLIVGSSSNWIALAVGSNGQFLGASSTAQGGISWSNALTGFTFVNATGTSINLTGSIGASGNRIAKLWADDLDSTLGTIGTLIISSVVSGDLVVNAGNVNLASTSRTYQIGGTTVLSSSTVFGVASTSVQRGSFSINLSVPSSTTDGAFYKHQFQIPITLTRVSCSDMLGTSTINFDRRVSSTPNTAGTNMITDMPCGQTRNTTTTFVIATSTIDQVVNFQIVTATGIGTTSTLSIYGEYTK